MTSNPYDDNYVGPSMEDPNDVPVDADYVDPNPVYEGPDEDIIPDEDTPVEHIQWMCSGVASGSLKRVSKESHMMPTGSSPSQPTTDTAQRFMSGGCSTCGTTTIWKRVTL